MNAWSSELADEFFYALNECDGDPDCRVILVTGEGRAFCAGADAQGRFDPKSATPQQRELREKREASKSSWKIKRFHDISLKLRQPVICAINGGCVGIGLSLAMACDMRFAAKDAKIGVIFPQRGLIAEDVSQRVQTACPEQLLPLCALPMSYRIRVLSSLAARMTGHGLPPASLHGYGRCPHDASHG